MRWFGILNKEIIVKELIKIEEAVISNEKVNAVSARELHKVLGSRQDFSTWVKNRIKSGNFSEGMDYFCHHEKMKANNATRIEYYLSPDMAKTIMASETLRNKRSSSDNIYVIQNISTKSIKIGISKDVEGRLRSLQTGNEHQLKLIYTKSVEDALQLESRLHQKFSNKRVRGEWFKASSQRVIEEVEKLTAKRPGHP